MHTTCSRSALLPYSCAKIFALVNDIDKYVEFLPWCLASEIVSRDDDETVARLVVGVRDRCHELVTRNHSFPTQRIGLSLICGPFLNFSGCWSFVAIGEGCKATLDLSFEFNERWLDLTLSSMVDGTVERILAAFASRADEVFA